MRRRDTKNSIASHNFLEFPQTKSHNQNRLENSFHIVRVYCYIIIPIHDDDVQPILHGVGDARMGGFTFTCQNGCIK